MVDSEGKPQVELKYDTLWKAIIRYQPRYV